jgi:hypothetical protein
MSLVVLLVLHQIAALFLVLRPGTSLSRRLLAATFVLLLPVAGVPLAVMVRRARGGRLASEPERTGRGARPPSADEVLRLTELPASLDRLMSPEPSERLAALVCLSKAGDANAIAVLRWTLEHGAPEIVLDAALTLEDLDLRREKRLDEASRRYRAAATFEAAVEVGDAAAAGLRNRLADPVAIPVLAEQARTAYLAAMTAAPEQALMIDERLGRLELAAGRPREALEILNRVLAMTDPDAALELELVRDAAAFAAREFDRMGFVPEDLVGLDSGDHPVFTRLDLALERAADTERRSRPLLAAAAGGTIPGHRVSTGLLRMDPA